MPETVVKKGNAEIYNFRHDFPAGEIKGDLTLETVVYIKRAAEIVDEMEKHLINEAGVTVGNIDIVSLNFENAYMDFPIKDIKDKVNELTDKMMLASENLMFEQAKEYRDLISHIQYVTSKQHVQFNDGIDRDILGYYTDKGYLSIQLFFMRNGKLLSRDFNLMPIYDDEADEVIRFITEFYSQNTAPKELLIPSTIDKELLEGILDCKIILYQKNC